MMRVPLLRGLAYARPLRRLARVEVGAWRSQTGRVLIAAEGRTGPRPCATKQKAIFCPIASQLQGGAAPAK